MGTAENIVRAVLVDLEDRSGFDGWWGDIDADIKRGILAELANAVRPHLPAGVWISTTDGEQRAHQDEVNAHADQPSADRVRFYRWGACLS